MSDEIICILLLVFTKGRYAGKWYKFRSCRTLDHIELDFDEFLDKQNQEKCPCINMLTN